MSKQLSEVSSDPKTEERLQELQSLFSNKEVAYQQQLGKQEE